jgi:hypothetical protein
MIPESDDRFSNLSMWFGPHPTRRSFDLLRPRRMDGERCVGIRESLCDLPHAPENTHKVRPLRGLVRLRECRADSLDAWLGWHAERVMGNCASRNSHPRHFPFRRVALDTQTAQIEEAGK